ncbi:Sodium/hydrogen exchanger 9B2 like protein [Argiope bruennichi]|uniref:Sodium/hydrogen exchanger 9B2 like protein n=1 Tax=Argiope bruennichi TaxID=94029 RepID=A0A8T0E232_ARGBR|nr:Sodium/hydrogen exchanger 9B2 like protein [Argiope bruennichi]
MNRISKRTNRHQYSKDINQNNCSWALKKERLVLISTQLACLICVAGTAYGILGSSALPGSEIFALLLLAVSAWVGGVLVGCLRLPALLGMLIVGILFRNIPSIPYHTDISIKWAATLRDISLVIILLKAGLGLDPQKLLELKFHVFKLSALPCLLETAASTVLVHHFLSLPWLWAAMLGFIVSAVSAAVLVPGMLALDQRGLGRKSGIPTLVMASVSIDNIIALTGFIVTFSILTSSENLTWTLMTRLLEPFIGLLMGTIIGVLLWYLPNDNNPEPILVYYRSALLCLGGLSVSFVCKRVGMTGAGALACVSLAFVASLRWRLKGEHFKHIAWITGIMWNLIEPFLFGLIGAEITTKSLGKDLGFAILALVLGVIFRFLCTIFVLLGSKLNLKEQIFVSASWVAKATVQAAVGSQALDYARSHPTELDFKDNSQKVLMMSVVSILLTAPLGAAFIDFLAPFLLKEECSASSTSADTSGEEERECITEVTVSDYGARRCASVGEIEGFLQGLKNNVND